MPNQNLREHSVAVPAGSAAGVEAVNQVRSFMPTGNEHLAVYSVAAPSTIWVATTDEPDRVVLAGGHADALLKSVPCELYHNHPSSRPFSVGDYLGLVDKNPKLAKMYAIGHDGRSQFEFAPTMGAQDIGVIADRVWSLTMNYAGAMWWSSAIGTFVPDDDWNARHGIGLGLNAAGLGTYQMTPSTPEPKGAQALIIRRVAKNFVIGMVQMANHCTALGIPFSHQDLESALGWLTKQNGTSVFATPFGALRPTSQAAQMLVTDPAFNKFIP